MESSKWCPFRVVSSRLSPPCGPLQGVPSGRFHTGGPLRLVHCVGSNLGISTPRYHTDSPPVVPLIRFPFEYTLLGFPSGGFTLGFPPVAPPGGNLQGVCYGWSHTRCPSREFSSGKTTSCSTPEFPSVVSHSVVSLVSLRVAPSG